MLVIGFGVIVLIVITVFGRDTGRPENRESLKAACLASEIFIDRSVAECEDLSSYLDSKGITYMSDHDRVDIELQCLEADPIPDFKIRCRGSAIVLQSGVNEGVFNGRCVYDLFNKEPRDWDTWGEYQQSANECLQEP